MQITPVRRIGAGTFGVVDEVEDEGGQRWAKKTFQNPEIPGVSEEDLIRRFQREVKYQLSLDHPNIVKIVAANLDVHPPFFVMELASGTLKEELEQDQSLGGKPMNALFCILSGLEAMHQTGIIHRDLTPANVLYFDDDGAEKRYAVSDFGLISATESESSTLTSSNVRGGTVQYAAPECAVNFKRATTASDIYSVGAILHDIFVGATRVPYSELTAAGPIGQVIANATKRLPQRRYQGIPILREDLFRVLSAGDYAFATGDEREIAELLASGRSLTDDEWDRIFIFLDDNSDNLSRNSAALYNITLHHLGELHHRSPGLFAALGREFCEYSLAMMGNLDFSYCDVLVNLLLMFYERGELDLQAISAIAALIVGTSHNRWYVERKFMEMAGPDIDDALANRICLEITAREIDLEKHIAQLENSINTSRTNLHPTLQAQLAANA